MTAEERAWVSNTVHAISGVWPVQIDGEIDESFERWLSHCIETAREVNLEPDDHYGAMSFRVASLLLSKRLGLTMTCARLERNLYFRRT